MRKIDSLRAWLKTTRFWDTVFAYSQGGLRALKSLVSEIATIYAPVRKAAKKNAYRPSAELLENRINPAGPSGIHYSSSAYSVVEGVGLATISVVLDDTPSGNVYVDYNTTNDTATGADYTSASGTITFTPSGSLTQTFTVSITTDGLDEDNETLTLSLSNPVGDSITSPAIATLTIQDDDDPPVVNYTSFAQSQGEDVGAMTVTFQLSAESGLNVTIPFTLDGTATPGSSNDYTTTASPVTIAAGQTQTTVTITVNPDSMDEPDETVKVIMGTPTNATQGFTITHVATIVDDDNPPTVSFSSSSQSQAENIGTMTVTAQLSAVSGLNVTVPVSFAGTADEGAAADYTFSANDITIAAGNTTGTVSIAVNDDGLDEPDETVIVSMGTPTNATLGATTSHTATITDNDSAPTVSFTAASQSQGENIGAMTITAQLSAISAFSVTVPFSISGGSATEGASGDFTVDHTPFTIAPGQTAGTILLSINDDGMDEPNETVIVSMGTPSYATAGSTTTHTATIVDNDNPPTVSFTTNLQSQGEDIGAMTATLQLSAVSGFDVTIPFTLLGTATQGSAYDYTNTASPVTITAGQTLATVTITVNDDSMDEPDETVLLYMGTPTNASLGSPITHVATIVDNDAPPTVSFSAANQSQAENSGTITVTVNLSQPSGYDVTVPFVATGSATATDDYTIAANPITIAAGQTAGTISINVVDDTKNETNETVILTMGTPTNATAGAITVHKAKITDNDNPDAVNDSVTTSEDTALTIPVGDLLTNDNDPAVLIISSVSQPNPANGGNISFDGMSITYTPGAGYQGVDTFTYTVTDSDGATDTAVVSITVSAVNDAPIARNDWADAPVSPSTSVTIDVLANDSDPDGDTITITSVDTSAPLYGDVSINDNGTSSNPSDDYIVYNQTAAHQGDDLFSYTITDGNLTATATVAVTLGQGQWADHVIAASSEWTDGVPYGWYAVQALGTPDTWEYGDIETAWAASPQNDDSDETLAVGFNSAEVPTGVLIRETYGNGFVTQIDLLEGSTWHDAVWSGTDGSASGSPVGFVVTFNPAVVTYAVSGVRIHVNTDHDGDAWEEIDAVKLFSATIPTFSNSAPTITNAPATASVDEGDFVDINVSSLASDPDSNPFTLRITTDPANGWLEINDNGSPTNLTDDFLTYTPDPDFSGNDSFAYEVRDIWGLTATGTVSITVDPKNDAPVVQDIFLNAYKNVTSTIEDVVVNYADDIDVGDDLTPTVSGSYASVSGDDITYYRAGYVGVDQFSYTVTDDGTDPSALADSGTVFVTVFDSGQWANTATGTSQYAQYAGDGSGFTTLTGAPDTFGYGDADTAWGAREINEGTQTLMFGFASTAHATGVLVREVNGNGFLTKIEIQDNTNGSSNTTAGWHTVWDVSASNPPGLTSDPAVAQARSDVILRFQALTDGTNPYNIQRVRLTVDTDHDMDAWEQIDAVRLLDGSYSGSTAFTSSSLNNAPTAADDNAFAVNTTPLVIHVLANDGDLNGDTLTTTSSGSTSLGSYAPSNGNTTITYTYSGTAPTSTPVQDSFTYTVSDGNGGTATATVDVTIYPDGEWAATVVDYDTQYVGGDYTGLAMNALGSVDGISWNPQSLGAGAQTLTVGFGNPDVASGVLIHKGEAGGLVTKVEVFYTSSSSPDLTFDISNSGDFPDASSAGGDFYVDFGGPTTGNNVAAIRITVDTNSGVFPAIDAVRLLTDTAGDPSNSAPTIGTSPYSAPSTPEGIPVDISVGTSGTNVSDSNPVRLVIDQAPLHGFVSINLGADPDSISDDYFTYTPDQYYNGTDSFTYKAIDVWGASADGTISLTVTSVNDAPLTVDDNANTEVETDVTITVVVNDVDPDGDTLTVQNVTDGEHGTTTLNVDKTITYSPDISYTGPDSFTYEVNDGNGHVTMAHVNVYVYAGQWATEFLQATSNADAAAGTILHNPDTFAPGELTDAWTPSGANAFDYIDVGFDSTDEAMGVLVREVGGSGFVRRVQLIDADGDLHDIWSGVDPSSSEGITEFLVTFPTVEYDVTGVRVTLDVQNHPDAAIDAIRLLTHDAPSELTLATRTFVGAQVIFTTYNDDGQPLTVNVYTQGFLTQTLAYAYTSGAVSSVTMTDAGGNQVNRTYDEDGNKLTETYAYGTGSASTTTYAYDSQNRMTSLTDPKGNETTWDYSVADQVTMTDPFGNDEVKTYNADGQLASILSRNNKLTTFEYTDGRLTTETWFDGPTDEDDVVDTRTWTYTSTGQIYTATNAIGAYTFTYNAAGQIIHVEQPFDVSLSFGYDSDGHRTRVVDSFGGEEQSLYDLNGNLVRRILTHDDVTLRIDQTFDQYGRVLTQTRYSDALGTSLVGTTVYTYDAHGNIAGIVHNDSDEELLAQFDYTYDAAGQLLAETDTQTGINSGTPWTNDYDYDDQGQLTDDGASTYDYDLAGNRDTGYTYVQNPDTIHYTNVIASDGTWDYTYDDNGNMIKKVLSGEDLTWKYGYDNANHLVLAQKWSSDPDIGEADLLMEAEYKYDVFGNRIEKEVDLDGEGEDPAEVQRYALDGWNPTKPTPVGNENYDVWADLDGDSSLTTRYLRGDSVDQLWGRGEAGTEGFWTLTDRLRSVRDVVDAAGALVDSIVYDGFGKLTAEEGTTADRGRYTWTGRELDVETGLQFNRARYYDSATGRWISQDPMGFDAGDSNLYRYVMNRATVMTDPSGNQQLTEQQLAAMPIVPGKIFKDYVRANAWSAKFADVDAWFKAIAAKRKTPFTSDEILVAINTRDTQLEPFNTNDGTYKVLEKAAQQLAAKRYHAHGVYRPSDIDDMQKRVDKNVKGLRAADFRIRDRAHSELRRDLKSFSYAEEQLRTVLNSPDLEQKRRAELLMTEWERDNWRRSFAEFLATVNRPMHYQPGVDVDAVVRGMFTGLLPADKWPPLLVTLANLAPP